MIGQTISHYQVLAKLGEGGMGVVWKARDTLLDRLVAIKVLPTDFCRDRSRLLRFEQEAPRGGGAEPFRHCRRL
jgi:serine/threonine protein kinase